MSASNHNWICFRCRFVARQPKTVRVVPKCADCDADLYCLGYKVEVPRKINVRAWRRLGLDCRRRLLARSDRQEVRRVRLAHVAEREVVHLRALSLAKGKRKPIRRLKEKARHDRSITNRAW